MKFSGPAVLLLLRALLAGLCEAVNVSVTPAPVVMATEGDNLTLTCLVSQRKRNNSFLVLRWFFTPPSPPVLPSSPPPLPPSPPHLPPYPPLHPSPPPLPPSPALRPAELLIVKFTMKRTQLFGNYSRGFAWPRFHLEEEVEGEVYRLAVLNVTGRDRGSYTCRVQEIRRHRNAWRASSNGTATTLLKVHVIPEDIGGEGVWRLFGDVYLCAVLICSLGLLSMLIFTLVLSCQYLHTRHRLKVTERGDQEDYLQPACRGTKTGRIELASHGRTRFIQRSQLSPIQGSNSSALWCHCCSPLDWATASILLV